MRKIKRFLRFFIRRFYYRADGKPIKCEYCGSKDIDCFAQVRVENTNCEEEYFCADCRRGAGYWAYGNFDPSYSRDIFLKMEMR